MKPVVFENLFTKEKVLCDDPKNIQTIDGIEYLLVHREFNPRRFLINRNSLQKLDKING